MKTKIAALILISLLITSCDRVGKPTISGKKPNQREILFDQRQSNWLLPECFQTCTDNVPTRFAEEP